MKKLFVCLLVVFGLTGCDKYGGMPRSFINTYITFDEVVIDVIRDIPYPSLEIKPDGAYQSFCNGSTNISKYDKLCKDYGDMTYYKLGNQYPTYVVCNAPELATIEIVSDTKWDERHQAGESLADIVTYRAETVSPYIENEYTGEIYTIIEKPLSEVTAYDTRLTTSIRLLFPTSPASLPATHRFTITIITEDGREFVKNIALNFSEY